MVKVNNTVRTVARDIFELKLLLIKSEKTLNVISGNVSSLAVVAIGQNTANIRSMLTDWPQYQSTNYITISHMYVKYPSEDLSNCNLQSSTLIGLLFLLGFVLTTLTLSFLSFS